MLNPNRPIYTTQQPWEEAVPQFVERLQQAGLQVQRTFDLQETRAADQGCACPNHGTEKCDCQMVVLLIYGNENQPVSLMAHSHQGLTWFILVEFIGETNIRVETAIREIFAATEVNVSIQ